MTVPAALPIAPELLPEACVTAPGYEGIVPAAELAAGDASGAVLAAAPLVSAGDAAALVSVELVSDEDLPLHAVTLKSVNATASEVMRKRIEHSP